MKPKKLDVPSKNLVEGCSNSIILQKQKITYYKMSYKTAKQFAPNLLFK